MLRALGPDLGSMTTLPAVHTELHGEMRESGNQTPARMTPNDLPVYESVVDSTSRIRMLVIGSFYGDSVEMWQEFLHPDSLIVGVDVDAKLVKIADAQGIHVRIGGDQTISSLRGTAAEFGPFDVILDTGSHTNSHMVDCFRCLFVSALGDGGAYIVDRVDCDYRNPYRNSPVSFIDLVRALIDAIHSKVTASGTSARGSSPNNMLEVSVPRITPALGSIEIYESIVIVRRTTPDLTQTSSSHQ
ncbi:hypothetical protein MYCO108962_19205 [Mycobacterium colombiense]